MLNADEVGVEIRMTSDFGVLPGLPKTVVHYLLQLLVIVSSRTGGPHDLKLAGHDAESKSRT